MPCASDEWSCSRIYVASAASLGCWPDWRIQYCITIAIDAAPQPSFDCWTNGTSSQIPGSAAKRRVQKHRDTAIAFATRLRMGSALANRHNNEDEGSDSYDDEQEIAVIHSSGGEVALRVVLAGCKLCQFGIGERR